MVAHESLRVRPIRAADAPAAQAFVRALSLESRRARFHIGIHELGPALLRALTDVDPRVHVALVAETPGGEIVADARYIVGPRDCSAEFALAVADERQRQGLGSALLRQLIARARAQGLVQLWGDVLMTNAAMIGFVRRAGGRFEASPEGPLVTRAWFDVDPARRCH